MGRLTEEQKVAIMGESGSMNQRALANKYGVSLPTIRRLIREEKTTSLESAEQVELPTESVEAPAAPAKFKSKKVSIQPETVTLPTEPVSAPAAPEPVKSKKERRVKKEKKPEVLELDAQNELDAFERLLTGAEDEEEEAIRLQTLEEEALKQDVSDVGVGRFKEAKAGQVNASAAAMTLDEEEALRALMGDDPIENTINEVVSKPRKAKAPEIEDEAMLALRAKTMSKIHLNVSTFGDHLPWIKNKDKFLADLYRKTTRELCDMCTLIETQRSLGNASNQLKHLFYLASQGVEVVTTSYLDMKTQGFATELAQKDKELTMIFQEIAIDSADTLRVYTTPHARLGMLFASTLFMVDNRNRMTEYRRTMEAKAPTPGIKEEYKDI
jgi:hypothetical protein